MTNRHCLLAAVLAAASSAAWATPIVDQFSTGPKKWAVPVKVYIPLDPARNQVPARNRHVQVAAGVQAWINALAGQNTGLNISAVTLDANGNDPATGQPPPADSDSTVNVTWTPNPGGHATTGTLGVPTGTMGRDPAGNPIQILKNQTHSGGAISISSGVSALEGKDNNQALKTMLHEMGHVLGIDHEAVTTAVMQPTLEQYEQLPGPGASDVREVKSIYTASTGTLTPTVVPVPGGFRYTYTATWTGGGEIALAQVALLGASATDVVTPAGWEVVPPEGNWPQNILQIRLAPTDELEAYLNGSNPTMQFAFTSDRGPGETIGWIGGDVVVTGPVPEPGVMLMGTVGAMAVLRRRRR